MNSAFRGVAATCLVALSMVIALPPTASADETPTVDNVFFQTDLRQALEDITAQTGVNIIADPSVSGIISVSLEGVELERALDRVLAGTGFRVSRQPDYYLVFNPDASADFFTDVAQTLLIRLDNLTPNSARSLLAQPLQRYVRVDEASERLAVTAPTDLMERIVADLRLIDQGNDKATTFVALEFIRSENVRNLLPENLQRFVRTDPGRNTIAVTAPEENRTEILRMIRRLDVPPGPASTETPYIHRTRIVKLQHARAKKTLALLPASLEEYVRADPESNTLAISAPRHLADRILEDINTIDIPRQHVMLDARVVVLERGDLLDFGVNWDFPTATAGTFIDDETSPSWPWGLRIGFTPGREFTNALAMTLNMLTQNEEATIVSTPQVLAQDGKEAEISVVTEEWFEITTDATTFARAQLEQIETGTVLAITPQVGSNGELTLDMDIEVSDVVGRGASNLPVVSRRTAHSTVQVENGGTAAVAGLVDTRSRFTRTGVPGVGRLPLLGRAFRSDQLDHEARQVAVFVTATLVEESDRLFSDGRRELPPVEVIDEDEFRDALAAALSRLETGARRDE